MPDIEIAGTSLATQYLDSVKHFLIFQTAEGNRFDLPIIIKNKDSNVTRQMLAEMHGLDRPWQHDDTLRYDLFWINFIRKTADADEPIRFRDDESGIIYAGSGDYDTIQFRWTMWVRAPGANITVRETVEQIVNNKDKLFPGSYAEIFDFEFDPNDTNPILNNHLTFLFDSAASNTEIHFIGVSSETQDSMLDTASEISVIEQTQEIQSFQEEEEAVYIKASSYGEPASFSACEDLEDEDVTPICPDCVPNMNYSEPNIVYHDGSYYNEKTCEYVTVFSPRNGNLEKVTEKYGDDIEKYIMEEILLNQPNLQDETVFLYGIKRLAKDFDKTQINAYFIGPTNDLLGVNEQPFELPLRTFTRAEWAIIPDTGQIKVKLSTQKAYFELLPPDTSPEPEDEIQLGQEEIEFDATRFYSMTLRARAGIKVYQKFYEFHMAKEKGYLFRVQDQNKMPIFSSDFDSLRKDLKTFRKHLFKLIREKGYRVNSFKSSLPFANNKIEKIKIKFDNTDSTAPYKIKAISVRPYGCRYRQIFNVKKDRELMIKDEKAIFLKDPRGFTFNPFAIIGNINDIDDDLQAYEPPTWEEFFIKYLVPAVDLEYGTLNSPLENRQNSLACAVDQFPNFGEFLKSSLVSLETVFELLAYEFNKITCAEDTDKAIAEFYKRYGSDGNLVEQFKANVDPNNGIVSYLIWAFGNQQLETKDIIGSLTFCELDGLLRLILECLLGGIPFEIALQKIVTKLISSLTSRHIGKLIGFLPASKQAEIEEEVQRIIGGTGPLAQPWSQNFAGGISQNSKPKGYGSGQGQQYADTVGGMSGVSSEQEGAASEPTLPGDSTTYALVTQDLAGATPDQVAQMNVDSKVSQVTTVILEAYIEALMTIVPIDDIILYIDRLPITPLIRTLIVAFFGKCQTTPLSAFADLGMLIPKFKIDICDPMLAIRIPKIPTLFIPSGLSDIMKLLRDMLIQIAISVFTKLLLTLLLRILAALDNLLCQGLAALARSDGDFGDILGQFLCDSDPEKIPDMLGEMLESMRGMPPTLAGDCVECIIKSFSRTLSKKEMLLIASGEPVDNNVYERVANSLSLTCPQCSVYFPDGKSIGDFCDLFPKFIPQPDRERARQLADTAENLPICDIICLNKEQLSNWDSLRRDKLEDMGLSPEAAAEEIDKLNEEALREFDDMLSSGVGLQDIIADEYDKLLNRDTGGDIPDACAPKTPWNSLTDEIAELGSSVSNFVLTPIEMQFYREMTGKRKSVLSRILSDTRGNTYNAHKFFASSFWSRSYYKDFEPSTDGDPPDDGSGWSGVLSPRGYFPKTIGADFQASIPSGSAPKYKTMYGLSDNNENDHEEIEIKQGIGIDDLKVINYYDISKTSDYDFSYERGDDLTYNSNFEYVNSINTDTKEYKPYENFGYTIKTFELAGSDSEIESPIVHQKIYNPSSLAVPIDEEIEREPYAVKYFKKYLLEKASISDPDNDNVSNAQDDTTTIYNSIFNSVFLFANTAISSSSGFKYGAVQQEITEKDVEDAYVNPEDGSKYNLPEEAKTLGKTSDTWKDRIFFLDPKIHGGLYTKPKIYIKPVQNEGWFSLYDAFSNFDPECDESNEKILPFNDIKKYHDDLLSKIPVDKRLYQEPECRSDIPFDRVYAVEIAALIDTLVRTTILSYSVDLSIKMMPALLSMKWKIQNYGPMFSQMLFDKMKKEMINEVGRNRTKNNKKIRRHRYWCLFMEQVAQAFQRQVDLNLITPTEKEEQALREIFLVRKRYKYPGRQDIRNLRGEDGVFNMNFEIGDFANFKLDDSSYQNPEMFYKYALVYDEYREDLYDYKIEDETQEIRIDNPRVTRLKRFRLQTKVYAIRTVEESVKVLFERIVSQEVNRYFNRVNKIIPPKINDIRHYMFNDNSFFLGSSMDIGTVSSEELYAGGQRTGFGEIIEPTLEGDILDRLGVTEEQITNIEENGGFIVERYVKILEYELEPGERPTINQQKFFDQRKPRDLDSKDFGITSLNDFREYVKTNDIMKKDKNLSHYFGKEDPAHFGIRISFVFPDGNAQYAEKFTSNDIKRDKTYQVNGKVVIPMASYEYPFIDETIEKFTSEESLNNYDNHCLIKNLVNTTDFDLLFNKIFPVTAPISLMMAALYTSFYNSIGAADGWDETRAVNDADQFQNIEDSTLKNTKKLLQKSFQATYRDQEYDKEDGNDHRNSMFGFLRGLIPDLRLNLGKFGSRLVRDIDDCDDPIFKLLRED